MSKVLCVADLHLRHDRPVCRSDKDWIESQIADLKNIGEIIREEDCTEVWLLGDIFHRPVEPPEIVNLAVNGFNEWKCDIYAIAGNHDLEHHSMLNWEKSSLSNLFNAGVLKSFLDRPGVAIGAYNFDEENSSHLPDDDIVLCHRLVFKDDRMKNLISGYTAEDMLKLFPKAKVILMGDYHEGWDTNIQNVSMAMIGCMNIQSGKLKDYKPRVGVFDTETLELKFVELPQDHVDITTEHLVEADRRNSRLEACMKSISDVQSMEFDFLGNLRSLASANNKLTELTDELVDELNKEK